MMPGLGRQVGLLFVLAIPVACVAWTVTHEEIFREPREWCVHKSKTCASLVQRKFFYLFTCEYCFSHYISAVFLFITRYKLVFDDWRGYLIAWLSLVWVANVYMSAFGELRLEIRQDRQRIAEAEREAAADARAEARLAAAAQKNAPKT